jgi:GlpG protein
LRFGSQIQDVMAQPWRLITPIFLHFSLLHILFNALWWWQFGGQIEKQIGSGKLLLITLVAALIPNIAQFYASGPYFGGLSGVVYALLGYLWWTAWLRPELGLTINRSIVGVMLIWLVMGFFDVLGPPTANLAHLFGLLVGCGQAGLDRVMAKPRG